MRRREENFMTLGSTHRRTRSRRSLALALALSLALPPVLLPVAAVAQGAAPTTSADLAAIRIPVVPATEGPIHTILMFPFANKISATATNGFDGDIIGARVEDAIKVRLNEIGRYKGDSFLPTLPQIQRAVQDSGLDGLTETDVSPPYDSAVKGRRLADQIATDGYLLGTIEQVNVNQETRTVSVVIGATLYSTTTGRAVKALGATGRGISFNANDDPASLLQSAINDAAGHVVAALNADRSQGRQLAVQDVRPKHHSNIGTAALGVLLVAATAIVLATTHHHHNSGGGGGTTIVPPIPVVGGTPPTPPTGL